MSSVGVSILRKIPFKAVLASAGGGPPIEKHALFSNQNEFNKFFNGQPPAAQIDFSEGFLFAISLNQRATGGHAVKERSVTQITQGVAAGAIRVRYEELAPTMPVSEALAAPYTIIQEADAHFATNINFHRVKTSYVTIGLIDGETGCQIAPGGSIIPMIYQQAFGSASELECR
jgi:hypothetical protein